MLSCKIIVILSGNGEEYSRLSQALTERYQQGLRTPKVGEYIAHRKIVKKSSTETTITIEIK